MTKKFSLTAIAQQQLDAAKRGSCAVGGLLPVRPLHRSFGALRNYVLQRLAIFVGKRYKRGRRFGMSVVGYRSPDHAA